MKSNFFISTIAWIVCCSALFGQPTNNNLAGAIPITPSPEGTGCVTNTFYLPFKTDGTTPSGLQTSCSNSIIYDQFFSWTATTNHLFFWSKSPGEPGITIWDETGTTEIDCIETTRTNLLSGWEVNDNLIIQIYDLNFISDISDVAFCLEAINFEDAPPAPPITFEIFEIQNFLGLNRGVVDMNGDFLDDLVAIDTDLSTINIQQQQPFGGFTAKSITTASIDIRPSFGLSAADYDRNGFTDLVYSDLFGVAVMTANNTGTGFTATVEPDVFAQRSNFVDINNDGNLDIFVCHDVQPNVYWLNDDNNNLSFNQGGLGDDPNGGDYGSIWIDYDNDRDLDLFIAKCGGTEQKRINEMHTNDGNENYQENAATIGLADPTQTWSSAWGDFDGDGDMDVFIGASFGIHKLMRNDNGIFTDISPSSRVNLLRETSLETVTFDFDNDGNLDLVSGGNVLFGDGNMKFNLYKDQLFLEGGAYGDLNNDGYIDFFNNGRIYFNNAESNNNWIKIHTIGTASNINGIGARVEVHTASGVKIRDVKSGIGFAYMSSLNTHVGIGKDESIDRVDIYWPSGEIDTVLNPSINGPLTVIEGTTLTLENSFVNDLVIYPNPTKTELNISSAEGLEEAIYTIFDVSGKRVMNAKLNQTVIDISVLNAGHYILRIVSGNRIKSQKFIKE